MQSATIAVSFVRPFQAAGGMRLAGTEITPWPGAGLHEELDADLILLDANPLRDISNTTRIRDA